MYRFQKYRDICANQDISIRVVLRKRAPMCDIELVALEPGGTRVTRPACFGG